ncbi:5-formyltetrahydrofolate cyclo-ligase, partial [Lucilia cuprina]
VLQTEAFRSAQRNKYIFEHFHGVGPHSDLLSECFSFGENCLCFPLMRAVKWNGAFKRFTGYETFNSLTKWHIKQPNIKDGRENALTNGHGIDLFLIPGVAFTLSGGRMGHGMGYYDKYLKRHQTTYPNKKTTLMALAFREQIVDEESLPLDTHDVRLHTIITE